MNCYSCDCMVALLGYTPNYYYTQFDAFLQRNCAYICCSLLVAQPEMRGCHGSDRMVAGFPNYLCNQCLSSQML